MRRLRLRYLSGPRRGDELIFSGPRVRIGRSRDNSLILTESESPASSGRHAEALLEAGVWSIVDSGSTNGTFVNGSRVERHRLASGDRLAFGEDHFLVIADRSRLVPATAAIAVGLLAIVAVLIYASRPLAVPSPQQIAEAAASSVYAVAIEGPGSRSIVGTAFAVENGRLATNAHVANALVERGAIPARALAIRGDTYESSQIVGVVVHPEWKPGSLHADVALLQLKPAVSTAALPLADASAFRRLRRGTSLASFGFPAISTDAARPRGRLAVDVVGDVRGEYLEAGLSIAPGTSGSPVFDKDGKVVAVVAGGDFVKTAGGALAPTGSQVNWAISAERVRELLKP